MSNWPKTSQHTGFFHLAKHTQGSLCFMKVYLTISEILKILSEYPNDHHYPVDTSIQVWSNTNSHLDANTMELTVISTSNSIMSFIMLPNIHSNPFSQQNSILWSSHQYCLSHCCLFTSDWVFPLPDFLYLVFKFPQLRKLLVSPFFKKMGWNDIILKANFSLLNSEIVPTLTTQIAKCICVPEYVCVFDTV